MLLWQNEGTECSCRNIRTISLAPSVMVVRGSLVFRLEHSGNLETLLMFQPEHSS